MDLDAYRRANHMSWSEIATKIGVSQAKQARAYGLGHEWPRAERLQAIIDATGGVVTVEGMHRKRLDHDRRRSEGDAA